MRSLLTIALVLALVPAPASAQAPMRVTANPYLGPQVSPYDARVSPYSSVGALNPYATTSSGRLVAADGTDLGRLNANPYDAESVASPFGVYGSPYSSQSITNPFGIYGSPFSALSPTNPYTISPPTVRYGRGAVVRVLVPLGPSELVADAGAEFVP